MLKAPFEYWVGFRYLLSRKHQAFLSVISVIALLGVAIGVMALTIVLSVLSGFQSDFREKILGNNAPLILFKGDGNFTEYDQVAEALEKIPGVKAASPFLYSESLLMTDQGQSAGVVLYGIDPKRASKVTALGKDVTEGSLNALIPHEGELPGVLLGEHLAHQQLRVDVGDTLNLLIPSGEMSPFGFGPKMRRIKVAGVFKSGMYEYDSKSGYVELTQGQRLFGSIGKVNGIQIGVNKVEDALDVGSSIYKTLKGDYVIRHWMEMNASLFNAFKLEKTVFFLVVIMIVLVASFNIVGTLTLLVITKFKEIAILKSFGARDSSISKIFIFVGSFISVAGTVIGLILGFVGCLLLKNYFPFPLDPNVYQVDHLPVRINPVEFLWVGGCAIFIGFLSTLYPAYKASQVEPAQGIRND